MLPLNAPAGPLSLEAVELFTGKSATLEISVTGGKPAPLDLALVVPPSGGSSPDFRLKPVLRTPARPSWAMSNIPARDFSPADESFGPHVRNIVVTDGGKLAVLNTMNWDHNLYALDVESGKLRWRQRAGHYFAFEPTAP